MIKHLNIKIFGRVQGVFFRYSAKDVADSFGINGFIRNEADGTVYMEAEGEESGLDEFLKWCKQGPEMAIIEKVEFNFSDSVQNFSGFNIE